MRRPPAPRAARPRGRRLPLLALPLLLCATPMMGASCNGGPGLSLSYGATARENYELASVEFGDRDYEDAIRYADYVRIRFPFSRYAVEAELIVARSHFELREYLTAKDAFKQFAKLHPTHRHVQNGWVAYMVAVSAYMAAPSGKNGILPAHYQLDQSMLEDALVDLAYFFDRYPGSELRPLAEEVRDEVQRRLLAHELYVARFYLDREAPEAAIGRLETASRRYPGIGMDAEILFLLGLTYLRIEEIELARSTFSELQTRHPEHHHGKQAKVYLRHIFDKYGPADPARPRPDRSPPVPLPPPRPEPDELPEPSRNPKERQEAREREAGTPAGPASGGRRRGRGEAAPATPPGTTPPESAAPASPAPGAPAGAGAGPETREAEPIEAEAEPPASPGAADPEASEADPAGPERP